MLSARSVSYILTIIWVLVFFIFKKKFFTVRWYFYVLMLMSSAGIFLDLDKMLYYVTQEYMFTNIILFAILLLVVLFPWLIYDEWIKKHRFIINPCNLSLLKKIYIFLISLSFVCIVYCLPYAIIANSMGAGLLRTSEGGLLPSSYMTTIASGIATLTPIGLLLFFISMIDSRLKKFTFLSLLIPLAGIIHSMACSARELYIFLPITFVILYMAFANSISIKHKRKITRIMLIVGGFLLTFFMIITVDRFGAVGSQSFINGTWGYIYQQPYVFDQTLQYFDNYKGFSKSLKFIGELLGTNTAKVDPYFTMEWSFGTHYKAFYEMYGYSSLIIGTISYIAIFSYAGKRILKSKNAFSIMINFIIFIWFTISGLFYFRYGGNDAQFILYVLMVLASPLYPNFMMAVKIKRNDIKLQD